MKNKYYKIITVLLVLSLVSQLIPVYINAKVTVKQVVKNARSIYSDINQKINDGVIEAYGMEYGFKEYMLDGKIRKHINYPKHDDMNVKGYTVEYYYDSKERLIFAYTYKKTNGKLKEYRAYYSTNDKCYRTINSKGKITDYKKGTDATNEDTMYGLLHNKGTWNIAVAHGG